MINAIIKVMGKDILSPFDVFLRIIASKHRHELRKAKNADHAKGLVHLAMWKASKANKLVRLDNGFYQVT